MKYIWTNNFVLFFSSENWKVEKAPFTIAVGCLLHNSKHLNSLSIFFSLTLSSSICICICIKWRIFMEISFKFVGVFRGMKTSEKLSLQKYEPFVSLPVFSVNDFYSMLFKYISIYLAVFLSLSICENHAIMVIKTIPGEGQETGKTEFEYVIIK